MPDAINDDSSDGGEDDNDDDNVSEHVSCFVHTLQLVVKDGFKHAAAINKVCKSILAAELLHCHQCLQAASAT